MFLQHVEELLQYVNFGLWWVSLGVASSIGLGETPALLSFFFNSFFLVSIQEMVLNSILFVGLGLCFPSTENLQ